MRGAFVLGVAALFGLFSFAACGGSDGPSIASTPTADGGKPNKAGTLPFGCEGAVDPVTSPCLIREDVAVFVSASKGHTTGDGTRNNPYETLPQAIAGAKSAGKYFVFACAETYVDALDVESEVSVFGNFDCNSWKPGSERAKVAVRTGVAVRAKGITAATRIEGFEFIAPEPVDPSASSVAMLAVDSPGLELVKVRIHAGAGANGTNGTEGSQLQPPNPNGQKGLGTEDCRYYSGPELDECKARHLRTTPGGAGLPGYSGAGGRGGAGGWYTCLSCVENPPFQDSCTCTVNTAPTAGYGPNDMAPGGGYVDDSAGGLSGGNGTDGTTGEGGGDIGTLTQDGTYIPSDGVNGTSGTGGQGGAGGGGRTLAQPVDRSVFWMSPTGNGGGAGGCPGLAGTAGKGGGASIGIVAIRSPFHLTEVVVEASNGGGGGKGTFGSRPTPPGEPGPQYDGSFLLPMMPGKKGGTGGMAGSSGSGGGGPSIGIAFNAGAVSTDPKTVITVGVGGSGVPEIPAPTPDRRAIRSSKSGLTSVIREF